MVKANQAGVKWKTTCDVEALTGQLTVWHLPENVDDVTHLKLQLVILALSIGMDSYTLGTIPFRIDFLLWVQRLQGQMRRLQAGRSRGREGEGLVRLESHCHTLLMVFKGELFVVVIYCLMKAK